MKYSEEGCCNIIEATFKKCLKKTRDKDEINNRLHFVEDGQLFKLWCIVANLDYKSLRNLVKIRNHENELSCSRT